jgi:hypothetical protein
MTDIGEVVGPRVHELQDVIAPIRVRDFETDRAATHVHLGDGVHGVVVDRHERVVGPGQIRRVREGVERRGGQTPHALLAKPVHFFEIEDQRESVDERPRGQVSDFVMVHDENATSPRTSRHSRFT